MLELLKYTNYVPPAIIPIQLGNMEVKKIGDYFYLYVDGLQWMAYNTKTHEDAFSVFSHYHLATGHVTVSGLGFGAREQWILSKPDVTKLTIIEKNQNVIDYHTYMKTPFLYDSRVEIINCDVNAYTGSCDVMLADHYETESIFDMISNAKNIHDNVDCGKFWFWPFERIIMHSRKWHSDNDDGAILITKHQAFLKLKEQFSLTKVPDIDEQTLNLFCMMHHSTVFSRSEHFLLSNCQDRTLSDGVYRSI